MKMVLFSFFIELLFCAGLRATAGRLCESVYRDKQLRDDQSRCDLPPGNDECHPLQCDGVEK